MSENNFNMAGKRNKVTWFGFTLNQKQALILFTLALIGVLFSPMIILTIIIGLVSYLTYDRMNFTTYNFQMLVYNFSFLITISVLLIVSLYTIIKTRTKRNNSNN